MSNRYSRRARAMFIGMVVLCASLGAPAVPASATNCVINTNDSGGGSLRDLIGFANSQPGPDTICFAIPGTSTTVHTINLLSPLPEITEAVTIDGYSEFGSSRNTNGPGLPSNAALLIELNGANAGPTASGLVITGGASTIRGLVINRFGLHGILVNGFGTSGNTVAGNFIGTDATGTMALPNGLHGVLIANSPNNTVGGTAPADRNVISGNKGSGVAINDVTAFGNVVAGNFIGTKASGAAALGNVGEGVDLFISANANTIGGTTAAARNVISGNGRHGVGLFSSATANDVAGNYIGMDVTGAAAIANGGDGVFANVADDNNITANLISGNSGNGVELLADTKRTTVQGNKIGTDKAGTTVVANAMNGVYVNGVGSSAGSNSIGGLYGGVAGTAARNLISGNGLNGVYIKGGFGGNSVAGNLIGTDVTGQPSSPLDKFGNGRNGVLIEESPGNVVGGASSSNPIPPSALPGSPRNVISGNKWDGVAIIGGGATGNQVQSNYIGTDVTGSTKIGNSSGVRIEHASSNLVGGIPTSGMTFFNLISGNAASGVIIYALSSPGAPTSNNLVQGNVIGIGAGGVKLGNFATGVSVSGSANIIGGSAAGAGNVISGNGEGIVVVDSGNTIQGNFIGTDPTGTANLGNDGAGIDIFFLGANTTIGGTGSGEGNTIAFNGQFFAVPWRGVWVQSGTGSAIRGNAIYSNNGLGIDLAPSGVTPNDYQDPDTGPNNLQNFPVIASATRTGGIFSTVVVQGSLNSTPNTSGFAIDFYDNSACDPSGYGEGQRYLGSTTVSTNANGDTPFLVALAGVPVGHVITATATDASDNTSEFSACVAVTPFFPPIFPILPGLTPGQQNSLSAKLNAALDAASRGNANATCGQIGAFSNEVSALRRSGQIDQSAASALIGLAGAIAPPSCP